MQVLHGLGKLNISSIKIYNLRTIHSKHVSKGATKSNNAHIKYKKMMMQFGKHKNGVTIKLEPRNKLFVTPRASSPTATAKYDNKKNFIKSNKRKPF